MECIRFVLQGKVQGVKMRRYVEATANYLETVGFVINTPEGHVYGEAGGTLDRIKQFERWLTGQWTPKIFTNIKPTPPGTAYPERAEVTNAAVQTISEDTFIQDLSPDYLQKFVMIRDETVAATMLHRIPRGMFELNGLPWSKN